MSGILLAPRFVPAVPGTVQLADDAASGTSSALWQLSADGFTYKNGVKGQAWIAPRLGMDQFEILVDLAAGGDGLTTSAGLGVWLAPGTNPQWGYSGGGSALSGTLNVQIRQLSDLAVVDTADISLSMTGTTGGTGGVPTYPPTDPPWDKAAGSSF